jgi:disulfide bond formation protein DsbB
MHALPSPGAGIMMVPATKDIRMNLIHFTKNPTSRALLRLAGMAAGGILAVALIGQYGFGLFPCHLCLYQRYPYLAIILLSLASYGWVKSTRLLQMLVVLVGLLFTVDAGIAAYHAGVEKGWFAGPSGCTNRSAGGEQTLEQMMAEIRNAPLVSCDQAMIEVFGLSMAAWNALAAGFCALATFFLLTRIRRDGT